MVKTTPSTTEEDVQLHKELTALVAVTNQYQTIVETVNHIIIGLKPDNTIFEWNKAAEKLYGRCRDDVLGLNYLDHFVAENIRHHVARNIANVLGGRPIEQFEDLILSRGETRIILWNVTGLLNVNSEPDGLIAVGQDITNYKQAEKEAHQSAQKYQQLLVTEQRHVRDLALLDRLRVTLARELDVHKLINRIVEAVADTFGYSLISLYLLEGDILILQHQVGYDHAIREIKISEGVSGRVARTGQPVLLQNAKSDPEVLEAGVGTGSEVSVPLFDQGKVVGTLNIESLDVVSLDEADLALVTAIGEHVSIAIERARLYTEIRRSEERFRIMFESAPIGLAIAHLDSRLIAVNPAFCRVIGYSADELLQLKTEDISYPKDMTSNDALHQEMVEGKRESYGMEKRYIAKDGRIIHTILQVALVRDANSNPLYSIGQVVDISERIRIENAEREQRQLAETLSRIGLALSETLDLTALLNLICRESVNLLKVHSAFIWLVEQDEIIGFAGYGYGHDMFIGLRQQKSNLTLLAARVIHYNRPEYINNAQKSDLIDSEIMGRYQCQAILGVPLSKGDMVIGALMILENRNPYRFSPDELQTTSVLASHAAVAIENAKLYQDLEQRVAERTYDLQVAYEEMKKLDKLKTKLIEDISHELRTPTANVLLYLDLLERGAVDKQPHFQGVIRSEVTRLSKLVEGVVRLADVDLWRAEAKFTAVNLPQLVQQIVAGFQQHAIDKNLRLMLEIPDDLLIIRGDERQVAEAIRHLLANALNYTQAGEIYVTVFMDEKVCVEIIDTGIGIDPEDMPHIFKRFYRGQNVSQLTFPGAGLGLFIVREIMKVHEGDVTVSSQMEEGSAFHLSFPAI